MEQHTSDKFDVVFIGSGPGGYVGAIRAAQLGFKVAVVEKNSTFGGTCLNVGCIPSKALLESSELFVAAKNEFIHHGIQTGELTLNLNSMMARKNKIVSDLTAGIGYLFKKHQITSFEGRGRLISPHEIEIIKKEGQKHLISTSHIVLATGSVPNALPFLPLNGQTVISSTEALNLPQVPKKMIVVGGGVIGLELGSVWMRLGSDVTVIEYTNKIGGPMDGKLSKKLQQILTKQGMKFILEAKVVGAVTAVNTRGVQVNYEQLKDKSSHSATADIVLVSTGRQPYSENLGLDTIGIQKDARGFIPVDEHFRTKEFKHIYAIGDLIPGPMLAHKAEEEGVAVAEIIAGQAGHVNYSTVPSVIYTWPEYASVGKSEEELEQAGIKFKVGAFPFSANGRAKALGQSEGLAKILADAQTDQILGVHILGPRASDLIAEAVTAMEFSASSEDLARTFHAHPTLAEVLREAALAVDNRARQM